MCLFMDRKNLYKSIQDSFKQSIIGPANPFTVDNPDVLLYNNHKLLGVYIPLAKEVDNPDLLLRRLYLSRLALSGSISSVLLLHPDESLALSNYETVLTSFDRVHVFENIPDTMKCLADNIRATNMVDKKLKRETMQRFWGSLSYIEKYSHYDKNYKNINNHSGLSVESWTNPGNKRRSKLSSYADSCIITSKGKTKQSFKDGYEDIMTFATMFNYSLSEGVIKRNHYSRDTFMYLNMESPEVVLKKPMNLRTMMFIGYIPCTISTSDDAKGINDLYYSFMKEYKYL